MFARTCCACPDRAVASLEFHLLAAIMAVLLLWGVYLARGAFLLRHNLWQGALVLICVLVYLCFWGGMLVLRRTRLASATTADSTSSPAQATMSVFRILGIFCALLGRTIGPRMAGHRDRSHRGDSLR